jgi:hypothetical protein
MSGRTAEALETNKQVGTDDTSLACWWIVWKQSIRVKKMEAAAKGRRGWRFLVLHWLGT